MTLRERDGAYVPDRLLRASDLEAADEASTPSGSRSCSTSAPASRRCRTARSATATASDAGRWNLRLDGIEPALTLLDRASEPVAVDLPRFDVGESEGGSSCAAACRRCASAASS